MQETNLKDILKPIRVDGDFSIFTTDQVDIFGPPDLYGYENFYVIESPPQMMYSYQLFEQSCVKKIHRYSRKARFKSMLRNLLGHTFSRIDETKLLIIKHYFDNQCTNPYETMRKVLKHFRFTSLYIAIPSLLKLCGHPDLLKINKEFSQVFEKVLNDFSRMETNFAALTSKDKNNRKYFPNLKFTALKILERNGVGIESIPPLRTKRKLKELNLFFSLLYDGQ